MQVALHYHAWQDRRCQLVWGSAGWLHPAKRWLPNEPRYMGVRETPFTNEDQGQGSMLGTPV